MTLAIQECLSEKTAHPAQIMRFGAGKIPKIAKDVGTGIREFKKSISGENENEDKKK